jgi:HSP20 family protein
VANIAMKIRMSTAMILSSKYGKFSRTIGLPVGIKQDQVEADYSNGILSLRLPKVEDAVNHKVKINLGGQSNQAIAGSQQS